MASHKHKADALSLATATTSVFSSPSNKETANSTVFVVIIDFEATYRITGQQKDPMINHRMSFNSID